MAQETRGFREKKSVVIRFAGDSGDGMQVVGERFTDTSVTVPNAIATFPDFPAEIRAPWARFRGFRPSKCTSRASRCSPRATSRTRWWR